MKTVRLLVEVTAEDDADPILVSDEVFDVLMEDRQVDDMVLVKSIDMVEVWK